MPRINTTKDAENFSPFVVQGHNLFSTKNLRNVDHDGSTSYPTNPYWSIDTLFTYQNNQLNAFNRYLKHFYIWFNDTDTSQNISR